MTTDLDLLHSRMTEIIEQSAQVLSTLTTCDGQPHATELHRRQARALADAGLLVQPMDKVALDRLQELAEERGYDRGFHLGWRHVALDQYGRTQ